MKYKTILTQLLLIGVIAFFCNTVQATVIISKSFTNAEDDIYKYLSENHRYENISDEFYVLNLANGALEKFHVTQEYNGEVYITFSSKTVNNDENNIGQMFSDGINKIWNDFSGQGFFNIPKNVVPNANELARYSFKRNDFQDYINNTLANNISALMDATLVRMAGFASIKIADDIHTFYTKDGAKVEVLLTYTRNTVKATVVKVTDKYNNTIPLTRAELNNASFRAYADDAGHYEALFAYLQQVGMTLTGFSGHFPKGKVIIIDCHNNQCVVVK